MRFYKPVFVLSLTILLIICLLQTDLQAEHFTDEDLKQAWLMEGWGGATVLTWYNDEGMYDKQGNWIEGKFAGASPYGFFWNTSIGAIKCYYSDFAKLTNNRGTKYPIKEDASAGWVAHNEWYVDSNYYKWDVTDARWGNYDIWNECIVELKAPRGPNGATRTIERFKAISELEFVIKFE